VARVAAGEPQPPPRAVTGNARAFGVMVRNALFQKVQLAARDRFDGLAELDAIAAGRMDTAGRPAMTEEAWEAALGAYWEEYDHIGTGPAARSPELLLIDRAPGGAPAHTWRARQIIDDPEGHHDVAIVAVVDLDASDAAGEPVILTESFG
jgi:hypothetical protein